MEKAEDPLSFRFNPSVGTGPYKLVEYDVGGYWFLFSHELDMADLTPESLDVVLSRNPYARGYYEGFAFAELLHPCVTGAAFNILVPPFDNKEMRWALNLALDAKELALTAYNGAAAFSVAYIPALLPYYETYYERLDPWLLDYTIEIDGEEYEIYDPTLPFEMAKAAKERGYDVPDTAREIRKMFGYGWWKHSPDLAEKLLLNNGFTRDRNGRWLLPDGTPWRIEVVCLTDATNPSFKWAFAIGNQWQEFGIDVEVRPTDTSNALTETGDYQIVGGQPVSEPFGSGIDLYKAFSSFKSDYWKPIGGKLVGHQTRWVSEELDMVINAMENTGYDDPAIIDLSIEAAKILIDGQPGVSLASFPGFMGLDTYYGSVMHAFPHQLSGGMRQRVTIALATILKPDVIFADEPMTALDVVVQRGVVQLIKKIKREQKNTVIIVTHDLSIHANLCDRLAIMYAGGIVEEADVGDLYGNPRHPYTRALLRSLPRVEDKSVRESAPGAQPSLVNVPSGCRFHPRCPEATERCMNEEPELVEVGKGHRVACFLEEESR